MSKKESGKAPEKEAKKASEKETAAATEEAGGENKEAAGTAAELEKELESLKEKLAKSEEELARQKDVLLRTVAEYDNYRKRTEREKAAIYTDAMADTILQFLPVEDNLERALAQEGGSVEDLRKGVEMVNQQMLDALSKLGVAVIGMEGEPFNPEFHNAVAHVENENLGENVIDQVFQRGYRIGEKIVRHAMVQVAN